MRNLHLFVYIPLPYAILGPSPSRKDLHNQIRHAVYAFLLYDPAAFAGYVDKIGLDHGRI
ncbi:MAG: hypothetical protein PHH46_06505, partial [Firmicutes bacterium]|jgi:hypothetical protein|nr:hypothetical protein [Bacillota bacterium]